MGSRKIIILNFMFSGEYLDNNIGHEIINLYTADSGKNYVYLCYDGKINIAQYPIDEIEHIVFVRHTGTPNQLEILGFTEGNLEYIPTNDKRQQDVKYGNKEIGKIFGFNHTQQDMNLTFESDKNYRLSKSFKLTKNEKPDSKIFRIKTALRSYIFNDENSTDYTFLKNKIQEIKEEGISRNIETLDTNIDTTLTMAEVYGIINRELPYSDALKFFIDKYNKELKNFFIHLSNNTVHDLGNYVRTLREWRNIDLIVEYKNAVFVIENKIFSKLNGIKLDDKKILQIS